MNIAKYTASIGFKVDTQDIKKVDRSIKLVEKKLRDFSKRISASYAINLVKFNVNQRALQQSLGNALDLASSKLAFEVSHFVVDQSKLNRTMAAAIGQATKVASTTAIAPVPSANKVTAARLNQSPQRTRSGVRTSAGIGGIGLGLMGPLGYGALALAGGGYGLGALNRRNQEVVSAQLQSQAVVQQAGGTAEQGQQSFQYLRSEANRIGFNYLDSVGDYNKLISGLTGSGFSVGDSQKVFSGFAELARVNKLDKTTQNRLFRALSQVAGKGKLQAEELTGQIAEALPGGTALFARAYQAQLAAQGKGGGLVGQAAISQLQADMKKGLVTSEILRYAGIDASTQANKGGALALASTASQAEQQRYQNTVSDLAVVASNAGVEEGFARIFRTLNAGLSESNGLVEGLASGFNAATDWADDLLLFPQDFIRALEGRDSLVADWLGIEKTKQLQEDWKTIKQIFTDISSIEFTFLPDLQSTAREIATIMESIAWAKNLISGNLPTERIDYNNVEKIDPFGTGAYTNPWELAKAAGNNFLVGLSEYGDRKERMSAINDPNSIYYNDPAGYDAMEKDRAMASQEDAVRNAMITNQIQIQLNVDAVTLSQMNIEAQADLLTQRLAIGLEQVMVFFPNPGA